MLNSPSCMLWKNIAMKLLLTLPSRASENGTVSCCQQHRLPWQPFRRHRNAIPSCSRFHSTVSEIAHINYHKKTKILGMTNSIPFIVRSLAHLNNWNTYTIFDVTVVFRLPVLMVYSLKWNLSTKCDETSHNSNNEILNTKHW